jgi:hypothetical protein
VQVFTDTEPTGVAVQGDGVLVAARDDTRWGIGLFKLNADGTPVYRLTAATGSSPTVVTGLAVGGGQILIAGATDAVADFDPGPGTDIVDRGNIRFVSRYSY